MKFKKFLTEGKELILVTADEKILDKISKELDDWNDKNDFAFQDYYIHKPNASKSDRQLVIEDPVKFKKYKKVFDKIIKKYT